MHKITVIYSRTGMAFPDAACSAFWGAEAMIIATSEATDRKVNDTFETSTENIIVALRAAVATGLIDTGKVEVVLADATTPGGYTMCRVDQEGRMHPCSVPAASLYKECLDAILYGEKR